MSIPRELKSALFRNYSFTGYTRRLYDSPLRFVHAMRMGALLRMASRHPGALAGRRVLEVGCLDLFFLCLLCESGCRPAGYAGVDVFWEGAEPFARENAGRIAQRHPPLQPEIVRGAAESFSVPEPARYDTAILLETIEHVDEAATLPRLAGWLHPGGHLLLSLPVEFGLLFGLREAARCLAARSTPWTAGEYLRAVAGRTGGVRRVPGDHKGYDYRDTLRSLEALGFAIIDEALYPAGIAMAGYGYVGLLRAPGP
jgi:SAM-dependent methyltransferase